MTHRGPETELETSQSPRKTWA